MDVSSAGVANSINWLTPDGAHHNLCRQLLRNSMAAVISSVIGYCTFLVALVITSALLSFLAVHAAFGLLSCIPVTMAGHVLISQMDRKFSRAQLARVRACCVAAITATVLGMAGAITCFIIPFVWPVSENNVSVDDPYSHDPYSQYVDPYAGRPWHIVVMEYTVIWYGPVAMAYYIMNCVVCSVLLCAARRGIMAVAPLQPLVPAGLPKSTEV